LFWDAAREAMDIAERHRGVGRWPTIGTSRQRSTCWAAATTPPDSRMRNMHA
jgi:hypothetical protein